MIFYFCGNPLFLRDMENTFSGYFSNAEESGNKESQMKCFGLGKTKLTLCILFIIPNYKFYIQNFQASVPLTLVFIRLNA